MEDLATLRQGLHVSVSQLKTYLLCPRKYELQYVRGIAPAFIPTALAFGSAFHAALQAYYHELRYGAAPPAKTLVDVFEAAWYRSAKGPIPPEEPDDASIAAQAAKGAAMLVAFHAQQDPLACPEIAGIEMPFSVDLYDPETGEVLEERLTGAFDLVLVEDERHVIVEHKTSARRYTEDQLQNDFQPTAYRYAAREIGMGKAALRYQVVTKTKEPAVQVENVERNEQQEDDFLRTAVGVLKAIDAGAFYPLRGWQCRTCPYEAQCRRRLRVV